MKFSYEEVIEALKTETFRNMLPIDVRKLVEKTIGGCSCSGTSEVFKLVKRVNKQFKAELSAFYKRN